MMMQPVEINVVMWRTHDDVEIRNQCGNVENTEKDEYPVSTVFTIVSTTIARERVGDCPVLLICHDGLILIPCL